MWQGLYYNTVELGGIAAGRKWTRLDLALKLQGSKAVASEVTASEAGSPRAESIEVDDISGNFDVSERQKRGSSEPEAAENSAMLKDDSRITRRRNAWGRGKREKTAGRTSGRSVWRADYEGPDGGYGYYYQGK